MLIIIIRRTVSNFSFTHYDTEKNLLNNKMVQFKYACNKTKVKRKKRGQGEREREQMLYYDNSLFKRAHEI